MRLVEKHMGYSVRPEICSDYQFSSVSGILLNIKNCIDIIFTNFLRESHLELSFMRGALSSCQFNSISAVLRWALRVRMDAYSGL